MVPVVAKDPTNPADALAAKNVFYLYNMAFLNAVAGGVLDEDLTGVGVPHPELAHRMDHLGINYYVRATVEGADGPVLPDLSPLTTFNPFRVSQDEVYPRGVYELMTLVHTQFGVPVVISENNGGGLPALDYAKEEKNLTEEFQWMLRAVDEGVPLKGYYYWTLMDNVEWNHGVMKYGLYAVDPADPTKARVRRPHADLLKRFATERRIPGDLIAKYPISE
jgi:beta-glucosidase/6-phospho-beta-glucosidase/beta-galactosidase